MNILTLNQMIRQEEVDERKEVLSKNLPLRREDTKVLHVFSDFISLFLCRVIVGVQNFEPLQVINGVTISMFQGDSFIWTTLIAMAAFIATNIDDLFILMLLFSQTDQTFTQRHVVIGQYLGFMALVMLSLAGFFGSYIVPQTWIGLLGLVPIAIGVYRFIKRGQNQDPEINLQSKKNFLYGRFLNPKIYGVALFTFANGGDNIGIYTPLFADSSLGRLLVILFVFMLLVGVWCFIGYWLTHRQTVARLLSRYGDIIVPFVLIAFGIYIIIKNGTLGLFGL